MIYENTVNFLMLTASLIQNVLLFLQRRRYSHHPDSSQSGGEQKELQAKCREADATAQFYIEEKAHLSCQLNGKGLHGRELQQPESGWYQPNLVKHNRRSVSALTTTANIFIENTVEKQKP